MVVYELGGAGGSSRGRAGGLRSFPGGRPAGSESDQRLSHPSRVVGGVLLHLRVPLRLLVAEGGAGGEWE